MATNRFMNYLGSLGEEETPQAPYKPKEEQTKQPEYPKFDLDASKPYAGIVEQVWGKPALDEKAIKRNNGIIKTQGLTDMLRLVAEGVTGSMGGDIIRRGENKVAAKAVQDNEKLYDIFRNEQARYNAMRMQEMLKNMDYGIRQAERVEDRKWQNDTWKEHFGMQNKAAEKRMKAGFAHSDANLVKGQEFQKEMFDKRTAANKQISNDNYNRELRLIDYRNKLNGSSGQGVSLTDRAGVKHTIPKEVYDKLSKEVLSTLTPNESLMLKTTPRDGQAMLQSRILDMYDAGFGRGQRTVSIPKNNNDSTMTGDGFPDVPKIKLNDGVQSKEITAQNVLTDADKRMMMGYDISESMLKEVLKMKKATDALSSEQKPKVTRGEAEEAWEKYYFGLSEYNQELERGLYEKEEWIRDYMFPNRESIGVRFLRGVDDFIERGQENNYNPHKYK